MKISQNEITGTQTSSLSHQFFWCETEFHPVFPFCLSASAAVATYIFTTYTTIIITLEPCA
jgi:hypothetical protein